MESVNNAQPTKLNRLFLSLFLTMFLGLGLTFLVGEVKQNQEVRIKASGSVISNKIFCSGKDLCNDGICVGETWRECKPCPDGKARAAYRISCDETIYSECDLDDSVCND